MALFLTYVAFTLKVGNGEKTTKMIVVGQNTSPPPRRRERASPPTGERRILSAIEIVVEIEAFLVEDAQGAC